MPEKYDTMPRDELLAIVRRLAPDDSPPPLPGCPCCKGHASKRSDGIKVWIECDRRDCGLMTPRFDKDAGGFRQAESIWARRPE